MVWWYHNKTKRLRKLLHLRKIPEYIRVRIMYIALLTLKFMIGRSKCWLRLADLPIGLYQIGRWLRIHIENVHSWLLVGKLLFSIGRSSAVYRPTIKRQSGDILGVGRPSGDDLMTGYRQIHIFVHAHCIIYVLGKIILEELFNATL